MCIYVRVCVHVCVFVYDCVPMFRYMYVCVYEHACECVVCVFVCLSKSKEMEIELWTDYETLYRSNKSIGPINKLYITS